MTENGIPFKPKGNYLAATLKDLKEGFDDPGLDELEPTLLREAGLPREPLFVLFQGEIFHQLALRAERRKEAAKARWRYEKAIASFNETEFLGRARVLRDYGLFLCKQDEPQKGLGYIDTALKLHDQDVQNEKGKRQRRITVGYLWRAKVLTGADDATDALEQLISFALEGCSDCSLRDQYFIVSFAREHAPLALHPSLDARLLDIHTERGKLLRTVTSIATWVIDTELLIAQRIATRIIRTIFRKE